MKAKFFFAAMAAIAVIGCQKGYNCQKWLVKPL